MPAAVPARGRRLAPGCPLDDDPVGYWRLDEPPGAEIARDSSGHGVDGKYIGAVTLGAPGAIASGTALALTTDTVGYVELADTFGFAGRAEFSIEAWILPDDGGFRHIFTKQRRANPKDGWALLLDGNGEAFLERFVGSTGVKTPFAAIPPSYTHVAATYDGEVQHLYVNGFRVGDGTIDMREAAITTEAALIGSAAAAVDMPALNFGGSIDEVAVYDRALEAGRIRAHFQAGLTQACP